MDDPHDIWFSTLVVLASLILAFTLGMFWEFYTT